MIIYTNFGNMFGFWKTITPVLLLVLSVGGVLVSPGCKKAEAAGKTKTVSLNSPFAGVWISDDSDQKTAFRLVITQMEDSIMANYCLVGASGQSCNCFGEGTKSAFVAPVLEETSLETSLSDYQTGGSAGRLRLTFADDKLYWRMVDAPTDHLFMVKQTTFSRDTSFHADKK